MKRHLVNIPARLNEETQIQFVGTKVEGKFRLGLGIAASSGEQAKKLTNGEILIVTDPTIVAIHADEVVHGSLAEAGFAFDVYDKIKPEPDIESLEAVAQYVRRKNYGLVIGLGGGSAMDTAKIAAVSACNDCSVKMMMEDVSLIKDKLPLILMPTTAGTGSEMSPYVVASEAGRKIFISSPILYTTIAMVDPLLMKTMPPNVTASTGMDALTHGVEGAIGKTNPYTLAMAGKCTELVFKYLSRAVSDGEDIEARYYMAFASVLGMLAYTQGGGLFAHSVSYVLTSACKLPHGAGCGLALPYTLRFNEGYIKDVLACLETSIGKPNFIRQLKLLISSIGAPSTLKEIGISEDMLPEMARSLIEEYDRPSNPKKMNKEEAVYLMKSMYTGD